MISDLLSFQNHRNMKERKVGILAKDGFKLEAILLEPDGKSRGTVQINSGTGIPKEFYKKFASYCADQGYVTIIYDYRGIGGSKPSKLKGFNATNTDWGTLDATAIMHWLKMNYQDQKRIVIGHSMGGQIVGLMENGYEIDEIYMIAVGTGYWKDMPKSRLKNWIPFLWYFYIPFSIGIHGYANAKKIKQGENLPKGVALEWRKWCLNESYWEPDFGKTIDRALFGKIKAPIKSITFTDDHITSSTANRKLLSYYYSAPKEHIAFAPSNEGLTKIGHFGFFSQKASHLWKEVL